VEKKNRYNKKKKKTTGTKRWGGRETPGPKPPSGKESGDNGARGEKKRGRKRGGPHPNRKGQLVLNLRVEKWLGRGKGKKGNQRAGGEREPANKKMGDPGNLFLAKGGKKKEKKRETSKIPHRQCAKFVSFGTEKTDSLRGENRGGKTQNTKNHSRPPANVDPNQKTQKKRTKGGSLGRGGRAAANRPGSRKKPQPGWP